MGSKNEYNGNELYTTLLAFIPLSGALHRISSQHETSLFFLWKIFKHSLQSHGPCLLLAQGLGRNPFFNIRRLKHHHIVQDGNESIFLFLGFQR